MVNERWLREVLPEGSWAGRPAVCIGGGPSLIGFDWHRLDGWLTIGTNRVFERHDPTIIFTMDRTFYVNVIGGRYGAAAREAWERSRALKALLKAANRPGLDGVFSIPIYRNYVHGRTAFSFSLAGGLGHGNNSGYGALNLAVCLGANPVYLLGYDMKHSAGRSHWHEGHPRPQREHTVTSFILGFNRASLEIAHRGISVVNLNPDSALKCFEFRDVNMILRPARAGMDEAPCA
jgi:hypothetical protein